MIRIATVLRRPGAAWALLAGVLAAGAAVVGALNVAPALDWQPDRWWREPWRLWTAAFVHLSPMHLVANLVATLLLGAIGGLAMLPARAAVAWCLAWPLTHLALLSMPELRHYGGLSGLLHGGVAIVAVHLVRHGRGREQAVGLLLLAALTAKVLSETPWRAAVQTSPSWDIPVAPIAHLTGAVAGLLCALAVQTVRRLRRA